MLLFAYYTVLWLGQISSINGVCFKSTFVLKESLCYIFEILHDKQVLKSVSVANLRILVILEAWEKAEASIRSWNVWLLDITVEPFNFAQQNKRKKSAGTIFMGKRFIQGSKKIIVRVLRT